MNYDELWQTIYQNLDAHHYSIAVSDLKKIYENDPSKKANQLLVNALVDAGDYLQAKEYLLEKINDYQDSQADFKLMIKIFGLNHNFIQGQILINSVKDFNFKKELQNDFDKLVNDALVSNSDEINQLVSDLYHIGAKKIVDQQRIITNAMNLPVKKYIDGGIGALSDPFLYPAIRFDLLDVFRELGVSRQIEIKWIDGQTHLVDCRNLLPLIKTKSAIGIFKVLEDRFGQTAPTVYENMIKTFNLFLAYLYPFNDVVIKNYALWVDVAYQLQCGKLIDLNQCGEDTKIAYNWQIKLLKIIDSIK